MATEPSLRVVVLGVTVLALIGIGWFVMSWRVMHTPAGDAGTDAVGVIFAVLVVISVIGAIRGRRRDPR